MNFSRDRDPHALGTTDGNADSQNWDLGAESQFLQAQQLYSSSKYGSFQTLSLSQDLGSGFLDITLHL